ncbi:MAG: hypothetical protein RL662_969 [Bacteroidota bacterium]|jgi:hypothetical protein
MNENLDPALQANLSAVDNENVNIETKTDIELQTIEEVQAEVTTNTQLPTHQLLTKEEIIARLKELSTQPIVPTRADVDSLKHSFFKLKSAENEALKERFLADGGSESDFAHPIDSLEETFKTLLNTIKEKRAKAIADEDKLKEENLKKKLAVIEAIRGLTESTDDFNKLYKEFKELQQQWNEIKHVPIAKVNELWKAYQMQSEKFYDIIKINNEFRDYDFKKNLELKNSIIEAVEKLQEESDIVSAFHQLQNFHHQWREIGPVSKEIRDEVWEKFKAASTEINKKHQTHFETMKGQEENNLTEKTLICEALKAIDYSALNTFKEWDDKNKEVLAHQAKWKTIGFVPKKYNNQIFEEYRALCDTFFEKKAIFFKNQRDRMEENLNLKKALCEKAEALKDSTDWKKTTDEMIVIQKEWKKIGPVPHKHSDVVWKQFVAACDYFFEQKNKNTSSQKTEETENLLKKKDLLLKIEALSEVADPNEAMNTLRSLMDEWHAIGFVPFKEKDKIYHEYQGALDKQFERLKMDKSERRLQSFKSNMDDLSKAENPRNKLFRERERLMHHLNKVKQDLQTYENNMGFLSVSKGASGSGLFKEMEHKIQDLRNELELIAKKVEAIDQNLKEIE